MKTVELFSGLGGLTWGLMQAGMECVGFVEMDKYAHKAFKILHDPDERMWSRFDITTVTDDDIRLLGEQHSIGLISAGFPCQSFSIAGKRAGFADATRGTLFFEIIRFAEILKPEYLLLENVKGLLNHDGGRTYATILCALDELGFDCEWQLLNSKDYGVPQNRERVFIVCHSRNGSGRKIFPISGENSNTDCILAGKLALPGKDQWNRVYMDQGLSPTLTTMQGGRQEPKIIVAEQFSQGEGISYCIDANYAKGISESSVGKGRRTHIVEPIPCLTPDRVEKRQNGRRFKEPGDPMFTLTAQDKHGVAIIDTKNRHCRETPQAYYDICPTLQANDYKEPKKVYDGYRIRKLTPLECFRLQSWPDEWYYKLSEAGISNSQLYRMCGNGVTSSVAFEIGKRLMEVQDAF